MDVLEVLAPRCVHETTVTLKDGRLVLQQLTSRYTYDLFLDRRHVEMAQLEAQTVADDEAAVEESKQRIYESSVDSAGPVVNSLAPHGYRAGHVRQKAFNQRAPFQPDTVVNCQHVLLVEQPDRAVNHPTRSDPLVALQDDRVRVRELEKLGQFLIPFISMPFENSFATAIDSNDRRGKFRIVSIDRHHSLRRHRRVHTACENDANVSEAKH
jgi:hypothetical protein